MKKKNTLTTAANSAFLFLVLGMICGVTYWSYAAPCIQKGYLQGSVNCSGYDFTPEDACSSKKTEEEYYGYGYYKNPNVPTGNFSPGCSETGGRYDDCMNTRLHCGFGKPCEWLLDFCWGVSNEGDPTPSRGPDVGVDAHPEGGCSAE